MPSPIRGEVLLAHRNFDQEKRMNAIETFKMDKGVISVRSLSEESDEKAYWHAKTPQERLEAVGTDAAD